MLVWSRLADKFHKHRLVLMGLAVAASVTFELLLIKWEDNYWYAMGVLSLFGAVLGGLLPLADYQILKLLSNKFEANKTLYGRQRMMGTVSFGLTTLLIGYLMDWKGPTVLFYALPVFSTILVLVLFAFGYPDSRPTEPAIKEEKVDKPSVLIFFKDPKFLFFLIVVFVTGCGRQLLQNYLPSHLKNYMKMDKSQAGYATVSSTIFSIVFMFIGGELIKFLGVYLMLALGMFTMGIRLGAYMYVSPQASPWVIYAIELLNGVAFSFTHLAGIKITADFAPSGLEATGQAIYTSSYMQLPAVIVAFFGGKLVHRYTELVVFGYAAKSTLVIAALVVIKYLIEGKINPKCG
jgi:MFS family permease